MAEERRRLNIRLRATVAQEIEEWSERTGLTQTALIEEAWRHYFTCGSEPSTEKVETLPLVKTVDDMPPNSTCKHCGSGFFTRVKYATICSGCKSTGHTNTPAECPRCTKGAAI